MRYTRNCLSFIANSLVVFLLTLSVAQAGMLSRDYALILTINEDGSGQASGTLVDVMQSESEVERIGCTIFAAVGGDVGYQSVSCRAVADDGTDGQCYSNVPAIIAAAASINSASWVYFSWDSNRECTTLGVSTRSQYIPTKKDK